MDFVQSCKHAFDDAKRSILTPYHTVSTLEHITNTTLTVVGHSMFLQLAQKLSISHKGLERQLMNFGAFQAAGPPFRAPAGLGEPTEARDGSHCLRRLALAALTTPRRAEKQLPCPGFKSSAAWLLLRQRLVSVSVVARPASSVIRNLQLPLSSQVLAHLGSWSRPSRPSRPAWCSCCRAKCLQARSRCRGDEPLASDELPTAITIG